MTDEERWGKEGAPLFKQARARDVVVEVAEGAFAVACDADQVRVMVSEGAVRVTRGGSSWQVSAGESWPAAAPVVIAPPPAPERVPEPQPEVRHAAELSKL